MLTPAVPSVAAQLQRSRCPETPETCSGSLGTPCPRPCFNEAGVWRPRRPAWRRSRPDSARSFNEAGARRPRKLIRSRRSFHELQRSRGPETPGPGDGYSAVFYQGKVLQRSRGPKTPETRSRVLSRSCARHHAGARACGRLQPDSQAQRRGAASLLRAVSTQSVGQQLKHRAPSPLRRSSSRQSRRAGNPNRTRRPTGKWLPLAIDAPSCSFGTSLHGVLGTARAEPGENSDTKPAPRLEVERRARGACHRSCRRSRAG